MSNHDIERATTSTADMVAAGLEQHARAITARVIQLLAEDRKSILGNVGDTQDMIAAVATQQANLAIESRQQRTEMLEGIHGLSQQLSEYEALISPKIAEMVYRHEAAIADLLVRMARLDGGGNAAE